MTPTAQAVGFVCQNQDAIVWLLGAIGIGNVVSWFEKYIPTPLLHIANVLGLNWDDVARAIIAAMKQPATTPKGK